MNKQNIYEKILNLYRANLDEGRVFMYENMGLLMRKNPLLKHNYITYTSDDIKSEAFMIADSIITREDIPDFKKISKLRYLFNKGGWALHDKLSQYNAESYNVDDIKEEVWIEAYLGDEILDWILVSNNIITPLEEKILMYLRQGRWKYEIARLMKTTYYNIKAIVDTIAMKVEKFLAENDINADNS